MKIWTSREIFGKYPTQNFAETVRGEVECSMWTERRTTRSQQSPFGTHLQTRMKMDLKETGWESMDWIKLAQNSDQERNSVKTAINRDVQRSWLATAV